MPVNNDFPILDGVAPSWCDIGVKFKADGAPLLTTRDIQAINTGISVEVGEQRGASGGRVMRRTTGAVSYEGSMVLYATGFRLFLQNLATAAKAKGLKRGNQVILSPATFMIELQWTPFGAAEIYHVRLKGCRYLGRTMNAAEGTDAQLVEVALSPHEIADVVDGEEHVLL